VEPLQREQASSTSPFALSSSALPLHLSSTSSAASDGNKTTMNQKPEELYQPSDRELEQALLSWCASREKARTGTVAAVATAAAESTSSDAAVLTAAVRAEPTTSGATTLPDEPSSPTFPRPALFMDDAVASMADDADRHRRQYLPSFRDVSSSTPFLSSSSGERDCRSFHRRRYCSIGNNNINDLTQPMNLSAEGMPHQLVVPSPHHFVPTNGGLSAAATSSGPAPPPLLHQHHHHRHRDSSCQLATMLHLAHHHHQQLQRQPAIIHQAAAPAAADVPTALDAFMFGML
jgi:hypothetical protein